MFDEIYEKIEKEGKCPDRENGLYCGIHCVFWDRCKIRTDEKPNPCAQGR